MLSETLNQSLIELEQSLVEINSARNQVSSVADKSEKLIDVFTDILKKLKSIDDNLGVDKGEFKERLDDSINSLNHSLLEVSSNVSSKSDELSRQLNNIVALFSEQVEFLEKDLGKFNKELQATEKRIGEIDLKKDLLEKIGQHQKETNELFQQKMIELETRLNAKFMGNLIGLIIGFIFLSLVVFLK